MKTKQFPKHWSKFSNTKVTDELEKAKNLFNNKLLIEKRPYFMRYLYPSYNNKYKDFLENFNIYSEIVLGCDFDSINKDNVDKELYNNLVEYFNQKNPLIKSNGVMNKICFHMENNLREIKKTKKNNEIDIFKIIFNEDMIIDENKLNLIKQKYEKYNKFKQERCLQDSEFNTYEQFYKSIRNESLYEISSSIQELAFLGTYLCYKINKSKPKDFVWDCFGSGIVEILLKRNNKVELPILELDKKTEIEYLHQYFTLKELVIE